MSETKKDAKYVSHGYVTVGDRVVSCTIGDNGVAHKEEIAPNEIYAQPEKKIREDLQYRVQMLSALKNDRMGEYGFLAGMLGENQPVATTTVDKTRERMADALENQFMGAYGYMEEQLGK